MSSMGSSSATRSSGQDDQKGSWQQEHLVGGIPSNKVSPCPSVKPGVVDEEMGMVDKLKAELKETKRELLQLKKAMQEMANRSSGR